MLDTELETHNIYKTYDVCSRQVKIHDRFYQTHRRCKDLVDLGIESSEIKNQLKNLSNNSIKKNILFNTNDLTDRLRLKNSFLFLGFTNKKTSIVVFHLC